MIGAGSKKKKKTAILAANSRAFSCNKFPVMVMLSESLDSNHVYRALTNSENLPSCRYFHLEELDLTMLK